MAFGGGGRHAPYAALSQAWLTAQRGTSQLPHGEHAQSVRVQSLSCPH